MEGSCRRRVREGGALFGVGRGGITFQGKVQLCASSSATRWKLCVHPSTPEVPRGVLRGHHGPARSFLAPVKVLRKRVGPGGLCPLQGF